MSGSKSKDSEAAPRSIPPGRTSTRRRAVTTWLASLGLAATIVGGHDVVAGTEVNARLFGTLVLGAGIVLIVGAAGLRGDSSVGRALATVAALLGSALGALIFMAQVVNDEPDRRLVLWAAIIVLSAAAFIEIREQTPQDEKEEGVWSQLPIVKSAVTLGVLISAAQFWYTSIYVPTTAPASLTLEPKIAAVTPRGDQLAVRGSVTVRNTSGTRVNVLASSLNLSGDELIEGRGARSGPGFREAISVADEGVTVSTVDADLYVGSDRLTKLAHRRLVEDGTYLEPGEVVTVPFFTEFPQQNRFDALALNVWLSIARGKVLAVETEEPRLRQSKGGVVFLTAVPEAGWLLRLTRGDRFVRTEYSDSIDSEAPYPKVSFAPDRRRPAPSDFNERLRRFYGVNEATGRALMPLPAE